MDSSPKYENSVIIYSSSSSYKPVWIYLFCQTQRQKVWRKFVTRLFWSTIDFHSRKKNTMEVNGDPELLCFTHCSEYLPLCSAEQRHSYRFVTTWGWVNDDRLFIFGWTIPLIWLSYRHHERETWLANKTRRGGNPHFIYHMQIYVYGSLINLHLL